MKTNLKYLLSAVAIASLAACGGNDDVVPAAAPAPAAPAAPAAPTTTTLNGIAPAPTAAPTAILVANQTEANTLATEAKAGLTSAAAAAQSTSLGLGVQTTNLPAGIVQNMSTTLCTSGTASYDVTGTAMTAGSSIAGTFGNCAMIGGAGTFNGAYTITFTRYNTAGTDFAFIANFSNFTLLTPTQTINFPTGGVSCDYKAGATTATAACYYSDGSRAFTSGGTYTNGSASGTYTVNYGGKVGKIQFTNFGTANGTATFTGANGYSAVIKWTNATTYTVEITVNGTMTSYTAAV